MFEAMKRSAAAPPNDSVIIAAPIGYNIFYFAPAPEQKPSMTTLQEMTRGSAMQPVIAWKLQGDKVVPLTVMLRPAVPCVSSSCPVEELSVSTIPAVPRGQILMSWLQR